MDEKKVTSAPEQSGDRDQALFASIRREKQRKKRRRIIVTVSIVVVLALAIFFGVRAAKKKVREAVGSMKAPTVSEAIVTTGSISTTVSGSGMLTDADTQQIVLPKGVKLEKILVKAGETVKKGDALATVELSSVMGAMSTVQAELSKLDEQLRNYISTMGISPELTREQVLASMGLDEKTFQEIMRPQAVFELQTDLLLDAIVKAENIELDEGELDETYNKMAEEYKMEVDKIKQYVDEKIIVLDMKRRKAAQLIRDTAVDKEPEAKEEAAE